MPKNRGTDYAETEAVLAALADDWHSVDRWLAEMNQAERDAFENAIDSIMGRLCAVQSSPISGSESCSDVSGSDRG